MTWKIHNDPDLNGPRKNVLLFGEEAANVQPTEDTVLDGSLFDSRALVIPGVSRTILAPLPTALRSKWWMALF